MSSTIAPARPRIANPVNPYRDGVQGKANEPITVAGILDRAHREIGDGAVPDWSLEAIFDRLEHNAPRVAIIGGSPDHPAHVMDQETGARAALSIWRGGGVPFWFSVPVLCDGTAQSNMGMSYSLQSRNAIAEMVVNQMEAHSYHGAFVIQSCDKMPLAVVSALAHLDTLRGRRGEAPVFAAFAPAHVLKGGTIPPEVRAELALLAADCRAAGHGEIAEDLEDTMQYILQCSSNTAFQGVFTRAIEAGVLGGERHKALEKGLAVNTCDAKGGICAFNGTGNSSRHLVAALGLAHPAVELLTDPPTSAQVEAVVADLLTLVDRPECGVAALVLQNMGNAIRLHSAAGGSTNLLMHLVGAAVYAGYCFSIWDLDRIHHSHRVPDLFDYSLTQGRDIFALARQCCAGEIRGMETLIHELVRNGVPMDLDAMTVTGTTWRERLADPANLSATGVGENPVILASPRRAVSGVDVLRSNWFESAVVKISGMPEKQVDFFDEQAAFVLAFETEEAANEALLDIDLLSRLRAARAFPPAELRAMARHNGRLLGLEPAEDESAPDIAHPDRVPHPVGEPLPPGAPEPVDPAPFVIPLPNAEPTAPLDVPAEEELPEEWMPAEEGLPEEDESGDTWDYDEQFDAMVRSGALKIAIVIAAQGPVAFGMPEMFTPMQHINANRSLRKVATLISDGRYSGVSYGAAVGHITPEAARGGDILRLQTGDLLHLRFRARRIDLLDPDPFRRGAIAPAGPELLGGRDGLAAERMARLTRRQRLVAASNRMTYCTDASRGVVPQAVWDECDHDFWDVAAVAGVTG